MPTPTKKNLSDAVEVLKDTERGRQVLRDLLALIENGGDGLDIVNQDAVVTILRCQFGPFAGSTRDEIRRAVGKRKPAFKFEPCGGCGADHPDKRCIGCGHQFTH